MKFLRRLYDRIFPDDTEEVVADFEQMVLLAGQIKQSIAESKRPQPSDPTPADGDFADFVASLSQDTRFEHMHLVAGTGHGKTQTLQYLIQRDLDSVARGKASIVVIDSQRQMIPTISRLKVFADGQPLEGRLIVVDPTDIKFPIGMPLFGGAKHDDDAEQERLNNSSISLLTYVFEGLLETQLTPYQKTLLGFVIRACMAIPEATIHTFRLVLEDVAPYLVHIEKLDPIVLQFFTTQYGNQTYQKTRFEVLSKLYGVFNNPTVTRLFSAPRTKFDLADQLSRGRVILIDTAKGHLQEGSKLLGRFFIAMTLQAAQQRVAAKPIPTWLYVDEAFEYFDERLATMLEQARKSRIGVTLAHQGLYQLGAIKDAVLTNTSIRLAGGILPEEAQRLGQAMTTTPEMISQVPKLHFAAAVRGQRTKVVGPVPLNAMENAPKMTEQEWVGVRDDMRSMYSTPEAVRSPSSDPPPTDTTPSKW